MKGSISLVLAVTAGLSACSSASKEKDGLREVDTLVNRIERVHVETELAQSRAHDALERLQTLVAPDFGGDSLLSFGEFVDAVEQSEDQSDRLSKSLKPMEKTADAVFERWNKGLEDFTSPDMRRRSAERLQVTRDRFLSVLAANQRAVAALEIFNVGLRDHMLYLQHDFNPSAVADLQGEVTAMANRVKGVDTEITASLAATREYVKSSALPRRMEAEPTQVARSDD